MAKKPTSTINKTLLKAIAAATASGNDYFLTEAEGTPLLNYNPPLIVVNTQILQGDKAASRITEAGIAMIGGGNSAAAASTVAAGASTSAFAIMKGVELPASRRGVGLHGGAPKKYPFEQMEVGDTFFVPVSEDTPNPLKTLGSTVSSANMRYAEKTGEMRTKERVKRGKDRKAVVGADGEKERETVELPVYNFTRKFEIRGIEKGKAYGSWTAPESGALIARTK